MQEQKNISQNLAKKVTASTSFKMLVIGFISLILLIPVSFVKDLIHERKKRKEVMITEVNREWGENVNIQGPILKIPYKTYKTEFVYDEKQKKNIKKSVFDRYEYLYVFPENLYMDVDLKVIPKRRGIYKTSVYKATTAIKGNFKQPDFKTYNIKPEDVDWTKAGFVFQTTNNKGIEERLRLKTSENTYDFFLKKARKESKPVQTYYRNDNDYEYYITQLSEFETGNMTNNPFAKNDSFDFSMNYNVRGSQRFTIVPIGSTTEVKMRSNWKDPEFTGEFLPGNEDKILPDGKGFEAEWKIIDYQRPFKKAYLKEVPAFDDYAFGVNLLVTVDDYLKTERSAKYAFLVIFLTFLVFFIIQNAGKIPMHAFHYFLIGLALVVFYTLLISISEHIDFNTSYLISATATVLLITLYSKAILQSKKFTAYVFSVISLLYLYIYVIIQLENYALLVGSIGLFIILAFVMYSSRKIKW